MLLFCYKNPILLKTSWSGSQKGYDCYPTTYSCRPRTAVYVRKELNFAELTSFSHQDCTVVFGKLNGVVTVIASIYLDILNQTVIPEVLKRLMTYVNSNNFHLILGIDSNAHSPLYGNDSSPRGDILEEFILEHQL